MKFILYIFLGIIISLPFKTHAHKRALYNIIIDTDGGQDDFRALTLFCASAEFNINAITSVDGVLYPEETSGFVGSLMKHLGHEGILIGTGSRQPGSTSKEYRAFALKLWESVFSNTVIPSSTSVDIIHDALEKESGATVIVALGPLSNLQALFEKYPKILDKIGLILWYNNTSSIESGVNYKADPEAFNFLIDIKAPLKIISSPDNISYAKNFNTDVASLNNSCSSIWVKFHQGISDHKFEVWDELCMLYLSTPTLFNERYSTDGIPLLEPAIQIITEVQILAILNKNKPSGGVIFNELPTSGQWLRSDSKPWIDSIIERHGYPEYKLVALTSEFHSHLGLYSVIGAKLGYRAMEYFHSGLDEISVKSFAGSTPPLSCLNDGLQVGTGATLGYGNIVVDTISPHIPAAIITYNGRSVHFQLKNEWELRINNDLSKLVKKYGVESDIYWKELRKITFRYWLDMDRNEIFDIKVAK